MKKKQGGREFIYLLIDWKQELSLHQTHSIFSIFILPRVTQLPFQVHLFAKIFTIQRVQRAHETQLSCSSIKKKRSPQ